MFEFGTGLYTDVRIEDVFETRITIRLGDLEQSRIRTYQGALVRVFDGSRWYYGSTSDVARIQDMINRLSAMAASTDQIGEHPTVKKIEVNSGDHCEYADDSVSNIPLEEKIELLEQFGPLVSSSPFAKMWNADYVDAHVTKSLFSSKGTNLVFDSQATGVAVSFNLANGERKFSERYQEASDNFGDLTGKEDSFRDHLDESIRFLQYAEPVKPGKHRVILSPLVAGVFAHESFGHKSEADFMIGDETMKREWRIGKRVGSEVLSIVDNGTQRGSGYVPFDDEGTASRATYLIKDGILQDRLHSAVTASSLQEGLTGNARAINFEFEPIVRMTTTYVMPGELRKEALFSQVDEGIYVKTVKHGSGMSTFTLGPSLAYAIRNGQIAEPLMISVVTGNVMETLGEIEALSDDLKLYSFVAGGCGKMEQFPLRVGFGGPHVLVRSMAVQ
jgi:TldD protein